MITYKTICIWNINTIHNLLLAFFAAYAASLSSLSFAASASSP